MIGQRWTWVFWVLVGLAVAPLLVSAVQVQQQLSDPELQTNYGQLTEAPFGFFDRWSVVTSATPISRPVTISAFLLACLGFVVVARTPGWLLVRRARRARQVVGGLAVVCATWAVGTLAVTLWSQLSPPTPWEQELGGQVVWYSAPPSWVLDVVERLAAAAVAGSVAVLALGRSDDAGVRGRRASRRRRAASAR